jgi:D-alanine-D-alanine ligase
MGRVLDLGTADDHRARRAGRLARALERLRRARIAVIHGGDADAPGAVLRRTYNPRPWKSYERVADDIAAALRRLDFAAVELFADDIRLAERLAAFGADLAWLNTGGVQGEAPMAHTPALLEMAGIPYVGASPLNAALLDAKHAFKTQLAGLGLPTAPFAVWEPADLERPGVRRFAEILPDDRGPFIVKPVAGRASLHVAIAETRAELPHVAATVAAASRTLVLIEPFLGGAEYCVSVMGPAVCRAGMLEVGREPFAFSALERRLPAGERIAPSLDRRPISAESFRLLEAPGDAAVRAELRALAVSLYRRMRLDHLVRIDLRRDAAGRLMLLEANPKPDLKRPQPAATSLVAAGLAVEGMSYEDLVLSVLANRLADYLFRIPEAAPQLVELAR